MATAGITDADLRLAQHQVGWTSHRIRVATALYNAGNSAAWVACALGGVTRNGVIGKINRDALAAPDRQAPPRTRPADAPRATPRLPAQRTREPRKATGSAEPHKAVPGPSQRERRAEIVPVIDSEIPIAQRKTLMEISASCCKWPVGSPGSVDFFVCGAPKSPYDDTPYCPAHQQCARAPAPVSRLKRNVHPALAQR